MQPPQRFCAFAALSFAQNTAPAARAVSRALCTMKAEDLEQELENVFPFTDKPKGIDLSFHQDNCLHCQFLRNDLEIYNDKRLNKEGIRELYNDMSCLSAKGWAWVFPSYLRLCLHQEASLFANETELLIYNLGPETECEEETKQRLSGFSHQQLQCILHFINWWQTNEHWSKYFASELERANSFISGLINA